MGWKKATSAGLAENTRVRIAGQEGVVVAPGLHQLPTSHYLGFLPDDGNFISYHNYLSVEIFEPDPPVKEYRETNYYRDTQTGTLYYVSGSDAISITHISASIHTSWITANPARFKRLFMEV